MQQTYIGGKKREDFANLEEIFKGVEAFMGYVPNAHLTMAEKPDLLLAFSNLAMTIFQSEGIDMQTKQLIALALYLPQHLEMTQNEIPIVINQCRYKIELNFFVRLKKIFCVKFYYL